MALKEEKGGGVSRAPVTPRTIYNPPKAPRNPNAGHALPPSQKVRRRRPTGGNTNYSNNNGQNRSRAASRRRSSNQQQTPSTPKPATAKVIVPPAPPKPVAPDLNKFLAGDSTYQRQIAAFNKSLADFNTDQTLAKSDYSSNYNNTSRDIGLAKTDASTSLKDDFASRGMLKSGLYNDALGQLNTQYQNQYGDLSRQQLAFLSQLGQEGNKYRNEQTVQKQNAQAEAARRRAEKYNL